MSGYICILCSPCLSKPPNPRATARPMSPIWSASPSAPPKGPRSRTICNISDLPEEVRELIAASLRGEPLVPSARPQTHRGPGLRRAGRAGRRLAALRPGSFPVRPGNSPAAGTAQSDDSGPDSFSIRETGAGRTGRGHRPGAGLRPARAEAFDEDELYEAMDLLNGQWVPLEKNLYQAAFPQGVRMVLYDLTSTYFEGARAGQAGPLRAQPGSSRATASR